MMQSRIGQQRDTLLECVPSVALSWPAVSGIVSPAQPAPSRCPWSSSSVCALLEATAPCAN